MTVLCVSEDKVQDAGDGGAQVRDLHADMAGQDQNHRVGECFFLHYDTSEIKQ